MSSVNGPRPLYNRATALPEDRNATPTVTCDKKGKRGVSPRPRERPGENAPAHERLELGEFGLKAEGCQCRRDRDVDKVGNARIGEETSGPAGTSTNMQAPLGARVTAATRSFGAKASKTGRPMASPYPCIWARPPVCELSAATRIASRPESAQSSAIRMRAVVLPDPGAPWIVMMAVRLSTG